MALNKDFLAAFAKVSVLTLFTAAAVFIPLGIFTLSLPCLALNLTGWVLLTAGAVSLLHFLGSLFHWLHR